MRGQQRAAALRARARDLVIAARQLRAAAAADDVSDAVLAHRRHRAAIRRKGNISSIYPLRRCVRYDHEDYDPDVLCRGRGCIACTERAERGAASALTRHAIDLRRAFRLRAAVHIWS